MKNKESKIPYECRVRTIRKIKIRSDGSTVERIITKHNVPINPPPQIALHYMSENPSTSRADIFVPTKSPMTKTRANGKKKWFRPKVGKRVFTKLAVSLIKEFGGPTKAGIINPVSKRVLKGYTKMMIVFPPNNVN